MLCDNKYRILSFWSLNDELKEEEIISQIEDMHSKNYGGFFLHARAGLKTEYLSDEWFKICRIAAETAERLGMEAWLYDENGWPSGFAGGLVPSLGDEYTAKHLMFMTNIPANKNIILAAYKKVENGYICLKENIDTADLFCCLGFLRGYTDLLNSKAVDSFIKFTHERYKEELGEFFGKSVKGIFTDEPQLVGKFPYTYSFPKEFHNTYGVDFLEEAWKLYDESEESILFKYQTSKLFAKLFYQNFTAKINEWCKSNNLVFTGHFSNEDGLCEQVRHNFNLMSLYSGMERPGIDFLGRRLTSPVLTKQISDAAFLDGKEMITSESFGCCGWDVTFNDLKLIAGYQAVFGINSIVTHLSAYSMKGRRKRDYPAFYSYQSPWWKVFGELSNRICQMNTFVSNGKRKTDIALIYPITSMWCLNGGAELISDGAKLVSSQFRLLVENLLDLQKDFLIITEEEFSKFVIEGNKLKNKNITFSTVIIPQCVSLEEKTLKLIKAFSEQGGETVFINEKPTLCEGKQRDEISNIKSRVLNNRRDGLLKYFLYKGVEQEAEFIDRNFGHTVSGLITTVREYDKQLRIFTVNPSKEHNIDCYLKVKGQKKIFKIENGKSVECSSFYDGKYTYSNMHISATECLLLYAENGIPTELSYKSFNSILLNNFNVLAESDNVLTIDRCDIYLNGSILYKNCDFVKVTDELYKKAYSSSEISDVKLIYSFTVDFKGDIPKNLSVAAECEENDIKLNGVSVSHNGRWWIDKSFKCFSADGCVHNGINTVEITFKIKRPKQVSDLGEFEGYHNILFYESEPESIYILGSFKTEINGDIYLYLIVSVSLSNLLDFEKSYHSQS